MKAIITLRSIIPTWHCKLSCAHSDINIKIITCTCCRGNSHSNVIVYAVLSVPKFLPKLPVVTFKHCLAILWVYYCFCDPYVIICYNVQWHSYYGICMCMCINNIHNNSHNNSHVPAKYIWGVTYNCLVILGYR